MKTTDNPILKDLVLVGGGHSHVAVLKRFGMKPLPGVRLTLICRDAHTPYSGMLPGYVAGHYEYDEAHIDLGALTRFANARFYHSTVTALDLDRKRVICDNRPPVPFELLSINTGSTPNTSNVPGASENVVPVKPINTFLDRWEALSARAMSHQGPMRIAVVGAGAGGVEILLAIQYRLSHLRQDAGITSENIEFHLFSSGSEILPTHNARVRAKFLKTLKKRKVILHLGEPVTEVENDRLMTENGNVIEADEILWVTAAGAPDWPAASGLDTDEYGFIRLTDSLQSISHPYVYAAGDVATMINYPRPKSGVFAVRQGKPLERNLRRTLLGRPPISFRPQSKFLSLISTGDKYAVASRGGWSIEGQNIWRWKDWIDRRFMGKFNELPEMNEEAKNDLPDGLASADVMREISAIAMRCGGCGAKVGANILARALDSMTPAPRDDVLIGLHEPDDAAVVEVPSGKVIVHTVDYFRAMVDDPYVFGKIAANHSLGDIFAMGGDPQTALAVATVPFGIESKVEDTLTQMMTGAMEILNDTNCALVGGHTSEGPELSLGFAVNGLIDKDKIMRKGGLCPGDKLIVTKPIGTGTLFAADMRHKAKGRWIASAIDHMVMSNRLGAECLVEYGSRAATDITGFGLLGHLVEMVRASAVDVVLNLDAVPLMEGAEETAKAGILSSLQPQNVRLRRAVVNLEEAGKNARYPLIFDPQTAGGLLASLPSENADACVNKLKELGYSRTTIIGEVVEKSENLEPITVQI
ncbi:MAG: Selenide, water dikinase [Alphaproteobacteria bacterium MarineAlpha11_Bin1]|nr:MAG: Selenide, water dikinase [Alphaproteobacteria bacterium MarineAlpha11_Bin1]|tara:strand:+ start:2949 stop:5216 length:2268 start_codon:yes stop_codon:yes gene_type:complete